MSTEEFAKRVAIVIALALAPILVWLLFDVVLIIIGAILFALLLQVVAQPFRWLSLRRSVPLFLSGILIASLLGGAGYLFGTGIATEMQEVLLRTGQAEKCFTTMLQRSELGKMLLFHAQGGDLPVTRFVSQIFSVSASFLLGFVIAIFAGIFLVAEPSLYRNGLSKLFPPGWRADADEAIDCVADALRLWLFGQMIEILIVGVLSGFALWLIGVPSPFALGVITGLAEFVPYIGPILAIVPSVLVAATLSGAAMLWTLAAYLLIHQIDGNLIMPVIQRQLVHLPPALMLLGIVAIGSLSGPAATIFAAPITVVLFVIVTKVYVRDTLGEAAVLPGESGQ